MNLILAIPLEARLAALFVLGATAGGLANLAIYRLAWNPRRISPWSAPDADALPRRLTDRIPIIGWLGLRREAAVHGTWFWVRPALVELLAGAGLAWLYWWEVEQLALLPAAIPQQLAPQGMIHVQFTCHAALIWLMIVASLIDIDERIIPDTVTIPGTVLGLALAAICPWSLPTVIDFEQIPGAAPAAHPAFLQLTSPYWVGQWPEWLRPYPNPASLALALACWWLWCVGLMQRTWRTRRGYCRAVGLLWARLRRDPATASILVFGAAGSAFIAAAWLRPEWIRPYPNAVSLGAGLACWWVWCLRLEQPVPDEPGGNFWAMARGWLTLPRGPAARRVLIRGAAGSLALAAAWWWAAQGVWPARAPAWLHWAGLLSALVGMGASGGLVWMVRVIGTRVLRKEAMGFGDVTLMAMIGTFLGWQTALLIFLLAPFYALGIGLLRWVLHSEQEIPYGPFLCLATLTLLVRWTDAWARVEPYFELGLLIPTFVLVCMALMAVLLAVVHRVRVEFFPD